MVAFRFCARLESKNVEFADVAEGLLCYRYCTSFSAGVMGVWSFGLRSGNVVVRIQLSDCIEVCSFFG